MGHRLSQMLPLKSVRESVYVCLCDSERVYTCIRIHEIPLARHFYFKIINTYVSGVSEAKNSGAALGRARVIRRHGISGYVCTY